MSDQQRCNDRLAEVVGSRATSSRTDTSSEESTSLSLGNDEFMKEFKHLCSLMADVEAVTTEMQNLLSESDVGGISRSVSECMDSYSKNLNKVLNSLKQMDKLVKKTLADKSATAASVDIQVNSYKFASKKVSGVMKRFDALQQEYSRICREKIKRTYLINNVEVSDKDLDQMIESGNFAPMLDSVAENEQKRQALRDVEDRHKEFTKLETAMQELYEMFNRINVIIQDNQNMVDTIEENFTNAGDYVETANVELEEAVVYRKSSAKKKIIIGIALLVVLVVVVILLVAFIPRPQKKS